jgi:hypothetical protein
MTKQAIPAIPTRPKTRKALRKSAAANARNAKLFQQTEFGRRRVRTSPARVMRLLALLAVPFVFVYRSIVRAKPR